MPREAKIGRPGPMRIVAIIGHAAGNHLSPTLEAVLPQSGASASVVASGGKVICARIQRNN
jgi:hypothetical protein